LILLKISVTALKFKKVHEIYENLIFIVSLVVGRVQTSLKKPHCVLLDTLHLKLFSSEPAVRVD